MWTKFLELHCYTVGNSIFIYCYLFIISHIFGKIIEYVIIVQNRDLAFVAWSMPGAQYRFLSHKLTMPVFLPNDKATIVTEKKQDSVPEQ